jgi:hypothetical protein
MIDPVDVNADVKLSRWYAERQEFPIELQLYIRWGEEPNADSTHAIGKARLGFAGCRRSCEIGTVLYA